MWIVKRVLAHSDSGYSHSLQSHDQLYNIIDWDHLSCLDDDDSEPISPSFSFPFINREAETKERFLDGMSKSQGKKTGNYHTLVKIVTLKILPKTSQLPLSCWKHSFHRTLTSLNLWKYYEIFHSNAILLTFPLKKRSTSISVVCINKWFGFNLNILGVFWPNNVLHTTNKKKQHRLKRNFYKGRLITSTAASAPYRFNSRLWNWSQWEKGRPWQCNTKIWFFSKRRLHTQNAKAHHFSLRVRSL